MPFQIIRNDITQVRADAIVNTANPEPCWGSGTDAAIYRAAGEEKLLAERKKIGRLARGEAAATPAFGLPAKFIIHTVGPVWVDGNHGEFETLRSCYRKSLRLAEQLGCESVAFPLIATGVYGFPKDRALETALSVIREYLEDSDLMVTLVVFGRGAYELAAGLTERVEAYIDEKYVAERREAEYGGALSNRTEEGFRRRRRDELLSAGQAFPGNARRAYRPKARRDWREEEILSGSDPTAEGDHPVFQSGIPHEAGLNEDYDLVSAPFTAPFEAKEDEPAPALPTLDAGAPAAPAEESAGYHAVPAKKKPSLEDVMEHLDESFQQRLFRMIDERKMTDPEVYRRANLDRKLFSKIRCNEEYIPKKKTIVALAIALRLNLDDTRDLLNSAGLALTNNSKADLIVRFCLENGIYDIFEVNALLFKFGQPTLG